MEMAEVAIQTDSSFNAASSASHVSDISFEQPPSDGVGSNGGGVDGSSSTATSSGQLPRGPSVQQALWGFFKLLQTIICCQETPITPVTHFAYRILEQAALKAGLQVGGGGTVGGAAGAKAGQQQQPPRTATEPLKHFLQVTF